MANTTTNNTSELATFSVLNRRNGARYEVKADSHKAAALEAYRLETGECARFAIRTPWPGVFNVWARVGRITIPVGPDEGYYVTRLDQ